MDIVTILNGALIVVSVLLTAAILMQSRSAGLGGAFGGGGEGFHVRRGSEKRIYQATVALGTLFLLIAFVHLVVS